MVSSAGLRPDDLDAVLLVGGSSRIPLVARLVSAGLGRPIAVDAHPKHPVALGAALDADRRVAAPSPGAVGSAPSPPFPTPVGARPARRGRCRRPAQGGPVGAPANPTG